MYAPFSQLNQRARIGVMLNKVNALSWKKHYVKIISNAWLFPLALTVCLILLTCLRISGSSVSVYSQLDGTYSQDEGLVTGQPRGVRSDEWLLTTQMTVAQSTNDFKKINDNIGNGQNMALLDVPYFDWSSIFRPQNIAFLILPLEYAFAFKWWLLLYLLILSCYFFVLRILPERKLIATLVSLSVGFSPFIFWWYQTITIAPIFYSLFILILTLRILKDESVRLPGGRTLSIESSRVLYALGLGYLLSSFALLLYPPFQIPCLIVVAGFIIGLVAQDNLKEKAKRIFSLWPYAIIALAIPLIISVLFYFDNRSAVQAITHTVYPGTRSIKSGGTNPLLVSSSFLAPNLQYDEKAASGYLKNQSEASNFIFLAPFLLVPSIYLIVRQRRKTGKLLWALLIINIIIVGFLTRMYISTPWLDPIYQLLLLDKVPHSRMLLGLGLAGLLQLVLIISIFHRLPFKKRELWILALISSLSCLSVQLVVGQYTINHFPIFVASSAKVLVFALWVSLGVFMIIQKRFVLGLLLLVSFSFVSVYKVHPLYTGLKPVTESDIIRTIKSYPEEGNWVTLDDRLIINFPAMAGKHSLNSVHYYPQFDIWNKFDREKRYESIYNRFAHVLFVDDPLMKEPISLLYADIFVVKFEPCADFLQNNAKYILTSHTLSSKCVEHHQSIKLPGKTFNIYEIVSKR